MAIIAPMSVPPSVARLLGAGGLTAFARACRDHSVLAASGLWGSSVAAVVAAVRDELGTPVILVCGHLDEADDLADDLRLFTGARPGVLPAVELSSALGRASEEQVAQRLRLVTACALGRQPDIVAPIPSLMQAVPTKDELAHLRRELAPGIMIEIEKLIVWLSDHGYNRLDQCEVPGDFAVRGGIVDVFIPGQQSDSSMMGLPVRIDFFGDQIESIHTFNIDTLGSGEKLQQIELFDIAGKPTTSSTSFFNLLKPETTVVFWQPLEIAEQARSYLDRIHEQRGMFPLGALLRTTERFKRIELDSFAHAADAPSLLTERPNITASFPVRSVQQFQTDIKTALAELAEAARSSAVTLFCDNPAERGRFEELLEQHQPGLRSVIAIEPGYLHRGFLWESAVATVDESTATDISIRHQSGLVSDSVLAPRSQLLLGHHELFNRFEVRRRVKHTVSAKPIDSFTDLQVGDFVVHVAHGIAKFTGIHTVNKDGKTEEYLTLRFAESATLHVPASRIGLIQKYVGGFSGHPQLSRLGSGSWEKQKEKVTEAVMDMAAELLEVQAQRQAVPGTAFPPDTAWQTEFEAEFPYTPTPDQVTCSGEIKLDMQQTRPMDRLLCGDVGYGKTELAMRAAFKAVEFGKQVAVLVPTTVLAEQHERSFRARFADYPFSIESVSRFKTGKELRDSLRRLEKGEVDILIGTHRLLSKDILFNDLGLVIVDEEQRFGVTHKERLKQFRSTVDVLTMSATPIPRTLHMSMVGLRDISSLTTAPQDRRSIVTEVCAYDRERVRLAIQRELAREGQVYYVHNRVEDIFDVAAGIQALVPDARIVVGHGQMDEGELEAVMLKFIRHEADILLCTTIIESGIDIPNANTMIIDNADMFGLSQLHQLRGRVGRYKHRAYCYLLLPSDRPVTPVAAKRLKAIEEYSHLGAGFKIAMRDLEIRGAGNILGPEQSGHIAAVGYELYCQLLEEAVHQMKTGQKLARQEAHVELGISAFIPKQYIPADRQRMDFYRQVSRAGSMQQVAEIDKNLRDAFGEPPRQVMLLIALTQLRLLASYFGIESIIRKEPDVVMRVIDAGRAQRCLTGAPGRLTVVNEREIYLRMPPTFLDAEACLLTLRNLMQKAYEKEPQSAEATGGVVTEASAQPVR
jgi:transcription-repair coupling factor (superfamily II helicase)